MPHKATNTVTLNQVVTPCSKCCLQGLCLTQGLTDGQFYRFTTLIKRRISLVRGDHLHRMNSRFRNIYIICAGSVKTYTLSENGSEQITAFHLPGEIIGMDALGCARYPSAAQALEATTLCEIPYPRLEAFAEQVTPIRQHLIRMLSEEILSGAQHAMLLGKKSAKARLAQLLLRLSKRFGQRRGCCAYEFFLSMSRTDIGNHLGLSTETISRLFTSFQEQDLITVNRKRICINNPSLLQQYADDTPMSPEIRQVGRKCLNL